MKDKKNEKKLKLIITVLIVIVLLWFIVINPLIKFKSMEKELLDAAKRYFEINEKLLPTGDKIVKVSLDTLYKKNFVENDLRAPYSNKQCSSENSWVRVNKVNGEYKYNAYLECGVFKSNIDHQGPTISLKGKDEVNVYLGEEYKDDGIESVYDNTDGKIDISKVKVDSSKVDTSKVGTYEVTYKITDSLENTTIKKRIVNVTETLNHVVEKDTDKSNIYKGINDDNYVMLDGIIFKIVGINKDNTVKIVSSEALGNANYDGIDSWLNDYFYDKLSDSAKEYIVKSTWCIDTVNDLNTTNCTKYSLKKAVGILSVQDYNKSKDDQGISNIGNSTAVWTYNSKSDKTSIVNSYFNMSEGGLKEYKEFNKDEIFSIKPAVNIKKDASIVSGTGTSANPYILKGNGNKHKTGEKISNVKTGTYISNSGYTWRVIGKDKDDTTEVVLIESLAGDDDIYYINYGDKLDDYDPSKKNTLAYKIINDTTKYFRTNYFDKKNMEIKQYNDKVLYGKSSSSKNYNIKIREISLFDLYSPISITSNSAWYQEVDKKNNQVYVDDATIGTTKYSFDPVNEYYSVRLVGYLNKNVVIKDGSGTSDDPYTITK